MYKIFNCSDVPPGVIHNLYAVPTSVMYKSWICSDMFHPVVFLFIHTVPYQDVQSFPDGRVHPDIDGYTSIFKYSITREPTTSHGVW
jgi:hypothetical protein